MPRFRSFKKEKTERGERLGLMEWLLHLAYANQGDCVEGLGCLMSEREAYMIQNLARMCLEEISAQEFEATGQGEVLLIPQVKRRFLPGCSA